MSSEPFARATVWPTGLPYDHRCGDIARPGRESAIYSEDVSQLAVSARSSAREIDLDGRRNTERPREKQMWPLSKVRLTGIYRYACARAAIPSTRPLSSPSVVSRAGGPLGQRPGDPRSQSMQSKGTRVGLERCRIRPGPRPPNLWTMLARVQAPDTPILPLSS